MKWQPSFSYGYMTVVLCSCLLLDVGVWVFVVKKMAYRVISLVTNFCCC